MVLRAAVFVLVLSSAADAVECAPIAGGVPELGHIDAEVRLRFLRERIRVSARRTRIWAYGWTAIYSGIITYNLAQLDPSDRNNLIDNGAGAGASLVGLLSIALMPPRVIGDQLWLERRLKHAPPGTDVCALVADAERLLLRDAKSAAFGKSPLVHAVSFIFNIGVGLMLGFGFDRWDAAALQGLGGIAVGEAMIISQPAEIVKDLKRYRAANLGLPPAWRPVSWGLAPMGGRDRAGMMVGFTF